MIIALFVFSQFAFAGNHFDNFDSKEGKLSTTEWSAGSYANQGNATWTIQKTQDAPSSPNALVRSGKAPYSWAVRKNKEFSNGGLEVAFNVLGGKEDPEAGIIWGFQDGTNYYYVRTNAVEDNIIFYRMNKGKKEHLKDVEAKTPFGTWHNLKIQINGKELTVFLDGKIALNTKNKEPFPAGKVGFFTSADTNCAFDDWKITSKEK
jgi:hypothetical protein